MGLDEEILKQACTTGCSRYDNGTCPFSYIEKDICTRVKDVLKSIEYNGEQES